MAKPFWEPTPEQRRILAAIKRAAAKRDEAEAAYRRQLAVGTEAAIPITYIAEALGVERKTVYRHLGKKMT